MTPGLHQMTNAAYHAEHEWLSSSMLKAKLPERYKAGGSQEALDFGTLFHTVVLEPALADVTYAVLDAATIGVKADGTPAQNPTMTAAWKVAVAQAESEGMTVVSQADWDKAHAMRDAVAEHATASALLFGDDGTNEESAFWADDNGVQHRARFDRRIPGAVIDLKSTSGKPGADNLARTVIDYGYDLSAAHYLAVANGLDLGADNFALVFVAKEPPYRVTVAELDETFLARGAVLRALAIERHLNTAPAYEGASGYLTLTAPRWARLDQEMTA